MLAAPTSLLRILSTTSGRLVLLVLAVIALSAPAVASGAAPDPSPSGGAVAPDPYQAPVQQAPVHVVVVPQAPVRSYRPAAPVVVPKPVQTAPAVRRPKKHSTPRASVAVPPTRTVIPIRRPDRPAPAVAARFVSAVSPGREISTALALAVAGLVLVSGAFLAGIAREVAR